ncbi:MAG: ISAs1 family transposase [Magnetospirillum sp. WYHS-4]
MPLSRGHADALREGGHPDWKGLRSIAAVICARTDKKTGRTASETRFYIASLPPEAKRILDTSRTHWGIENNLHWTLDVTFREDACRSRKDNAPLNLALVRKIALNLVRQDKSCKLPLKRKRLKAALEPDYRAALIGR